jgi:hypothetical protein
LVQFYFVVKLLGFPCMCIGEKTFYHSKFQLLTINSSFKLMQELALAKQLWFINVTIIQVINKCLYDTRWLMDTWLEFKVCSFMHLYTSKTQCSLWGFQTHFYMLNVVVISRMGLFMWLIWQGAWNRDK